MTNHNLTNKEERFKEVLSDARWEVNTDDIWGALEGKLPPKQERKRRIIPWFWASIALFLLMAFTTYQFLDFSSDSASENTIQEEMNSFLAESIANKSNEGSEDSNFTEDLHSTPSKPLTTTNNSIRSNSISSSETPIQAKVRSNTENKDPKITFNAHDVKASLLDNQAPSNFSTLDIGLRLEPNSKPEKKLIAFNSSEKTEEAIFDKKDNKNKSTLVSSKDQMSALISLPLLNVEGLRYKRALGYPSIQVYTKPRFNNIYFLLSSGFNITNWSYESSDGPIDIAKEEAIPGISGRFLLGIPIHRHFAIEGGFSFQESIGRYKDQFSSFDQQEVDAIESVHIDAFGQSTEQSGKRTETTYRSHDLQWHRRHKAIHANLGLIYNAFPQSPLNFSLHAGLAYNLHTTSSGYYLSATDQIQKFQSNEDHIYKARTGLSTTGGIRLTYQINQLGIHANSFYNKNLGSLTQGSNPFLIKSSQIGLELGLVYRPHWE